MKIKKIEFKNFASYGNKLQTIEFDETGKFYLIVGENGMGKCLDPSSEIEILIEDDEFFKKFKLFKDKK